MPVERLSGGMQRRLCLAMTLLHKPKLVILDEPTTGLDIEARQEVWQLIRQFQHMGITVLLTSHLLDEVERLCQRIGILKQGCLLAEGTLEELRRYVPASEIVTIQTNDPASAIARARQYGYVARDYGPDLNFWVSAELDLKTLVEQFEGIPLDSIAPSSCATRAYLSGGDPATDRAGGKCDRCCCCCQLPGRGNCYSSRRPGFVRNRRAMTPEAGSLFGRGSRSD